MKLAVKELTFYINENSLITVDVKYVLQRLSRNINTETKTKIIDTVMSGIEIDAPDIWEPTPKPPAPKPG